MHTASIQPAFGISVEAVNDLDSPKQARDKADALMRQTLVNYNEYLESDEYEADGLTTIELHLIVEKLSGNHAFANQQAIALLAIMQDVADEHGFYVIGFTPCVVHANSVRKAAEEGNETCTLKPETGAMVGWRIEIAHRTEVNDLYKKYKSDAVESGDTGDDPCLTLQLRMWLETGMQSLGPMYMQAKQMLDEKKQKEQEVNREIERVMKGGSFRA